MYKESHTHTSCQSEKEVIGMEFPFFSTAFSSIEVVIPRVPILFFTYLTLHSLLVAFGYKDNSYYLVTFMLFDL